MYFEYFGRNLKTIQVKCSYKYFIKSVELWYWNWNRKRFMDASSHKTPKPKENLQLRQKWGIEGVDVDDRDFFLESRLNLKLTKQPPQQNLTRAKFFRPSRIYHEHFHQNTYNKPSYVLNSTNRAKSSCNIIKC